MGLDRRSLEVYVVTSGTLVRDRGHREIARAAIDGGASALQLRAPELDDAAMVPLAEELGSWSRDAEVLFVVNDRIGVAIAAGADGAHVGQDDELGGARERLGPDRVLGVSVEDPEQARAAEALGADYLGATVWPSATKPEASAVGLEAFRTIVEATALPVVGIGGIDAANAARVLRAGAAGVAVISAVAATPDPAEATRELRAAVDRERRRTGGAL